MIGKMLLDVSAQSASRWDVSGWRDVVHQVDVAASPQLELPVSKLSAP